MSKFEAFHEIVHEEIKRRKSKHENWLQDRWEELVENARQADDLLDRRRGRASRKDDDLPDFELMSLSAAAILVQRTPETLYKCFVLNQQLPVWYFEGQYHVPSSCIHAAVQYVQGGRQCIPWERIRNDLL